MRFIESEKSWKFDDEQRSGGKIVIQCHGEEKGGVLVMLVLIVFVVLANTCTSNTSSASSTCCTSSICSICNTSAINTI